MLHVFPSINARISASLFSVQARCTQKRQRALIWGDFHIIEQCYYALGCSVPLAITATMVPACTEYHHHTVLVSKTYVSNLLCNYRKQTVLGHVSLSLNNKCMRQLMQHGRKLTTAACCFASTPHSPEERLHRCVLLTTPEQVTPCGTPHSPAEKLHGC